MGINYSLSLSLIQPKTYIVKLFASLLVPVFFAQAVYSQNIQVKAYYHGSEERLENYDPNKLTHIIFCFGQLSGSRYKVVNAKDSALIKKMVAMKSKNRDLKVILSLGGWGGCETCSDAFFTSEGRTEFAKSFKEVNDYFGTDGIDLDWEYPTVRLDNDIDKNPVHKTQPEDKKNFTDLVRQLRKVLGKKATITFAAGGFQTFLEKAIEWHEVMKEVDYVNMMTYDLVNGYATVTGHHTPLYSNSFQHESTDNAIKYLLRIGIDPRKIIVGAAFYARVWENVPAENNGLHQPGKFKEGIPFRDFEEKLSPAQGFKYFWDSTAQAPYMYNASRKLFATFDDNRSIELKTKYVKENKLGGIMFWQLESDKPEGGLLDKIIEVNRNSD
jgi:chitinase